MAAGPGASQPGTVAGDGGRGRLSLLRHGQLRCCRYSRRCSNHAGFAGPYRLTVLPGGERCLAELLRFINKPGP